MTDNDIIKALECCGNSNTKKTDEKIKAIYPHIVVGGSIDKPYYSIHWYDIEAEEMICGYGSYNLAFVRMWLESDFEIVDENIINLIKRQRAKIKRLKKYDEERDIRLHARLTETARSEAIKEFAEKIDKLLERYAHIHEYADAARQSTEDYADGTPMDMANVWEVLSLEKWGMVDYKTMSELQDNIETIAKERLLSELEKDFYLLVKEMTEGV